MDKYYNLIDKFDKEILSAERYLWDNPESGYKEFKTNSFMIDKFKSLGYELDIPEGITGFITTIDTRKDGPTILVLAELDSLINFSHKECDKETGAVHSCGHHAQCAAMLGLASALKEEGALDGLSGKIKLCLVPAEEGIEIGFRNQLIKEGKITFTSGKPEFISRGFFDDVDIAFMLHVNEYLNDNIKLKLFKGHNGVIRKITTVKGKASHAGANPDKGINALNAASLIILAINSLRETFKEEYFVRIHSIITKGGDSVNTVPDEVVIESYVRAADPKVHKLINEKVNRTISACAAALGASVNIQDFAGSEAFKEDSNMRTLAIEVFSEIVGKDACACVDEWQASSTDMGDVACLVPAIHFYSCGAKGALHSKDFTITDPYTTCVVGAKAELGIIRKLLENDAVRAKDIIKNYKPVFNSIDEYLKHKKSINMNKDTVIYNDDGTVTLDYKG